MDGGKGCKGRAGGGEQGVEGWGDGGGVIEGQSVGDEGLKLI